MATAARQVRRKDRRMMGVMMATAMAMVAFTAQPAAADVRPLRVAVKSARQAQPVLEPVRLAGDMRLAGAAQTTLSRTPRTLSRTVGLDVFAEVALSGDSAATETVRLYVDGKLVAYDTLIILQGGPTYELPVLHADVRVPAAMGPHEIKVVMKGTFSSERIWMLNL